MSADTRKFFGALFERKPDDLSVVLWRKGADEKRTTYSISADAATRDALDADGDVYVGVGYAPKGAHRTIGPRRRPSKSQVAGIVGLWADIDVIGGPEDKKHVAPDRAAAIELASSMLEPTMLVHSGYGVQAWWLLTEPWLFGDSAEERGGAGDLAAKWLRALRDHAKFELDSTHDITRVLRVPGTFNLKGGERAAVELIELDDDRRYELDDFAPHIEHVQLALGRPSAPADEIVVEIRADADPPFELFTALHENDPDFATAWARSRRGEKEQAWSASEWDMALADRAARARWRDQEITDLLVASRRKHGDDLKRPDYYARTIARVRATVTINEREQERLEAIKELTAPPVSANDNDPEHVLALFEKVVGVKLSAFVQYGRDPDEGGTFELMLGGKDAGRCVRFPNFDELANPLKFRNRIATATSTLMPRLKGKDWDEVVERLLAIVEVHDSPAETAAGVFAGWLRGYLAHTEAGDRGEAIRAGYPHRHDDKLYVSREHFQQYIRTRYGERIARRDLIAMLKSAGFRNETVSYRKTGGQPSSTSLYARPLDDDEGAE